MISLGFGPVSRIYIWGAVEGSDHNTAYYNSYEPGVKNGGQITRQTNVKVLCIYE